MIIKVLTIFILIISAFAPKSVFAINFAVKKHYLKKVSKAGIYYLADDSPYPNDWHLLDIEHDHYLGASVNRALMESSPLEISKDIIVAVIDSGIDINHPKLNSNIWINKKEIPNNFIDDDNNGYVDDIMGWNFIGHSKGMATFEPNENESFTIKEGAREFQLQYDTLSIVRRYKYLKSLAKPTTSQTHEVVRLRFEIEKKRKRAKELLAKYQSELDVYHFTKNIILESNEFNNGLELTISNLEKIETDDERLKSAIDYMIDFLGYENNLEFIQDEIKLFKSQLNHHYNIESSGRELIVKDTEKFYGNNSIIGPDAEHGTHIAGILTSINKNVKVMPLRVVPEGDERDIDVANAITYAVNNGAKIINLSFGKQYSQQTHLVEKAIEYANSKNVLIIHAAGNENLDNDKVQSFPSKPSQVTNWLAIGASNARLEDNIMSEFSNFGKESVDYLAPGEFIYSTLPNNSYGAMSGTSMAAPMVAGVMSVLMSYAPDLNTEQAIKLSQQNLYWPKLQKVFKFNLETNTFEDLFRFPGIINLNNLLLSI